MEGWDPFGAARPTPTRGPRETHRAATAGQASSPQSVIAPEDKKKKGGPSGAALVVTLRRPGGGEEAARRGDVGARWGEGVTSAAYSRRWDERGRDGRRPDEGQPAGDERRPPSHAAAVVGGRGRPRVSVGRRPDRAGGLGPPSPRRERGARGPAG